jgi:hypothetical protein
MPLFMQVPPQHATSVKAANLLASALPPPTPEDQHWQEGIVWRSELCPGYQVLDPCADETTNPPASGDGLVYYHPLGYRVTDVCSARNVAFDIARVSRMTDAVTSFVAANELWTGAGTQAAPYDTPTGDTDITNAYLAGPTATVISGTVADPMEALGLLEERARQAAAGQQVFLHVPTRITTQLGAQLRRVGNVVMTQTDGIVVADPGYPGTGPDGSAGTAPGVWCYATGPVVMRTSDIDAITEAAVTLDRRSNRRQVWAERMFAATFDPCCHFALQIS